MARDHNGTGLVPGGVRFYVVFEGVVIDIICIDIEHVSDRQSIGRQTLRALPDGWRAMSQNLRRLHSGTDSFSKFCPYFIACQSRVRSEFG
jgi:hypothetical protein